MTRAPIPTAVCKGCGLTRLCGELDLTLGTVKYTVRLCASCVVDPIKVAEGFAAIGLTVQA